MDFSDEALEAARMLDKKHEVEYLHGSFDEIGSGKKIGCLITLGFMQGSTTDTWISPYRRVIKDNDVKNIVVDVLPENEKAKQHTVDFDEILVGYKVEKKVGPLLGDRYLLYYRKQ